MYVKKKERKKERKKEIKKNFKLPKKRMNAKKK